MVADLAIVEEPEPEERGIVSLDMDTAPYPHVTFTPHGLVFAPDTPYDEWEALGITLRGLERSLGWAVIDWFNHGAQWFPDRYTQALEITDYRNRQSLYNVVAVGKRFPADSRRDALSFTHHQEVVFLPPEVGEELLDEAEAEGLSTKELRQKVINRRQELKDGRPLWSVVAEATSDEWLELEAADGEVAQIHIDGGIYYMDQAGRKFHIRDLNTFVTRLYSLRDNAKRHFGQWPQK